MTRSTPSDATTDQTTGDRPRPRRSVVAGLFALTAAAGVLPWWLIEHTPMTWRDYPLWGFSPVLPLCLYGGAFLRSRAASVLIPAAAWAAQGLLLAAWWGEWEPGWRTREAGGMAWGWAVSGATGWVVGCLAATAAAGWLLRRRRPAAGVLGLGLGSAVAFFLVTNFGSWFGNPAYPQTIGGLLASYAAGLPFFRGTLLSVAVFVPALFFLPAAVRRPVPAAAPAAA